MNDKTIDKLIELRKENGLSQEALAEKLGISRQAISKWERGESSPDTDNLICLAKLYNISLDELLDIKQNEKSVENINEDEDEDENLISEEQRRRINFINGLFSPLCIVLFFIIGFAFGKWHPGWTIFLLIPTFSSLLDAIYKKKPSNFAYPVFITFIYVLFSSIFSIWHPLWIIYLTIPVYYLITDHLSKKSEN